MARPTPDTKMLQGALDMLFEVGATDRLTFGLSALMLGAVALLACWIPARRATKVDPLTALKHE